MEKNESEKIIRETIEFANNEIEKNKKRTKKIVGIVIIGIIVILIAHFAVFSYEMPIKYQKEIVDVVIPEDKGIDIHIDIPNYKRAYGFLKEKDEGYDLYIGITQTLATKMFKDTDGQSHLIRVGNGMIVDYHGERLMGFIPGEKDEHSIQHIYYVDGRLNTVEVMSSKELAAYKEKILIWKK